MTERMRAGRSRRPNTPSTSTPKASYNSNRTQENRETTLNRTSKEASSPGRTRLVYSTGGGEGVVPKTLAAEMERKTRGARIRLERRASGRVVTVIADVPGRASEVEALAKLLKARCGTGGSVRDVDIELQGDRRDAVQVVLREQRIPYRLAGG